MFKQSLAFRGLAILLVVVNHTTVMGKNGLGRINITPSSEFQIILNLLALLGLYAVPLFLFYSGCYVNYAIEKRDFRHSYKVIFSNILTILWPYLIWSCVFYLVIFLDGGTSFSFFGYLKNLIVGYPFNFVPILIFFYLLSPLLRKATGIFAFVVFAAFLLYQVVLILLYDPNFAGLLPDSLKIIGLPILHEPLMVWGIYFPLGVYIKYLLSMPEITKKYIKIILGILAILLLLLNIISILGVFYSPWLKYMFPLPFILFSIFWRREDIPLVKIFERLGKRSYGLYLINLIVMDLLILLFNKITQNITVIVPVYFIFIFIITITLPLLFMEWFERNNKKLSHIIFG